MSSGYIPRNRFAVSKGESSCSFVSQCQIPLQKTRADHLPSRSPAFPRMMSQRASVCVLCSRSSHMCCHIEFIPFSLPVVLVCISLIVSFNLSCNFPKLFHFCVCLFSLRKPQFITFCKFPVYSIVSQRLPCVLSTKAEFPSVTPCPLLSTICYLHLSVFPFYFKCSMYE